MVDDSNVLNWFQRPTLLDNDNVFNVEGTTSFSKDAIIKVFGDPAASEPDYCARWVDFVRAILGGGTRVASTDLLNYTVTKNDGFIRADTSGNVVNANLPPSADFFDAVNDVGYTLTLKNLDGSNDANYVGNGGEKVEGISPYPITGEGNSITIISIGVGLGWELT